MNIYGVLDRNDCHIDVSASLKGTKRYATLNGYTKVSIRYNCGYNVSILFEKVNGKWKKFEEPEEPHHPDCPAVDGFACHCS